ncbi:proline iminopeptidase isoform X1 [Solanum stenotomum]|uniref:proline iminopeptidase isoform X1 n=1 Tax=Solanum stenotomum TaxID=172797 RepID=UPI0020D1D257|nr:proline iminopeptidase isoform X1 [Solanum stenotomum]
MKLPMKVAAAAIGTPSLFPCCNFVHLPASTSLSLSPRRPASIFSPLLIPISGRKKLFLRAENLDCESVEQMDLKKEFPELNKDLYPSIEPYCTGFLKVSDLHTIYWEQSGNPNGCPAVFFHGGPGGGTSPNNRRFFDPVFYRIILFDQRGAGKSKPHACLEENTTWDLVGDIEKLREHLKIPEWQVFGGSWGSTLALAYSISHPEKVTGIILRGIFLLRKKEIDWFYEGGAAAIYPDVWEPFRDLIPEEERKCFVKAYHKRLNSDTLETQYAAARAWTKWEMMTSHLLPNEENIKRGDDDDFSLAFARIENHYFINKGFFSSDSFLLDNVEKIKHIKTIIVQGRYDVCCPMMSAWDLHKAWPEAEFIVVPGAGHSANEPGIAAELVAANEKLKNVLEGVS